MPYRDAKTVPARGQVQLRYIHRVTKPTNVFQCLIVSANRERRAMFERAAVEGGWKTSACVDAAAALVHIARSFLQLAIVDLEGQSLPAFRPIIEKISAAGSGLLLIVCGNEGQVQEEIWARQAGAWLYLPGVSESSNLALLCGEAKQIAERLHKANGHDRPASPSPVPRGG